MNNKINIGVIIRESKYYYVIFGTYILLCLFFLFAKGYYNSFLFLNYYHYYIIDFPMLILTYFGDSLILSCIIILSLKSNRLALIICIISSIIITGLIAQFLKINFFSEWNRPPKVFGIHAIHVLPKYVLNYHSFPSGHATTLACAFTFLAYEFRNSRRIQILLGILLILLSYTRIYLGVHFLGDVVFGNLIGIVCSIFVLKYFFVRLNLYMLTKEHKISIIYKYLKIVALICLIFWAAVNFKYYF